MDFMAQSAAPQLAQLQNQLQGLFAQYEQLNKLKPAAATPSLTPGRTSSLPFVSGADGARAYLKSMAANSSDAVFDKEDSVFYLLSVDANGVPAPDQAGAVYAGGPPGAGEQRHHEEGPGGLPRRDPLYAGADDQTGEACEGR